MDQSEIIDYAAERESAEKARTEFRCNVIRSLDEAGFVIVSKGLHQSLRRMVDAFCEPPFQHPIGAPNSVASAIQNEKIAAYAEASVLAYPKDHLR